MEMLSDAVSQILSSVTKEGRELTETEVLLLTMYKKELRKYDRKPGYQSIIETINSILFPKVGGEQ